MTNLVVETGKLYAAPVCALNHENHLIEIKVKLEGSERVK